MKKETKPWYSSYPAGMPLELETLPHAHLSDMLTHVYKEFAAKPAFENFDKTLSFAEIGKQAHNFAAYLQHDLGLKPGDRIALQMPNLLQYPIALFGALQAGLVVVNTNPLYTATEMHHQFEDAKVAAIVILENFAFKLEDVLRKGLSTHPKIIITRLGDMLPRGKACLMHFVLRYVKKAVPKYVIPKHTPFRLALSLGSASEFKPPSIKDTDLAFLQYTGGTTGTSKAAMLSHKNVLANIQQISLWLGDTLTASAGHVITALPLYHIFALSTSLVMLQCGAKNTLITNPRDMKGFLRTLAKTPATFIAGVNTLYKSMMAHPAFARIDFSHLKLSIAGGMTLHGAVAQDWQSRTGVALLEGYGLSETSPVLTINPLDGNHKEGSAGLPLPGTDVQLLNEKNQEVALGEVGEVCVRGPQVMSAYWQQEQETKDSFINGFFRTGDIAKMSKEGFLYIIDRKKELINVSGFKVYPGQVEEVIAEHPAVIEVGVRGLTNKEMEEEVHAFVVRKDPSLQAEAIRSLCKEKLTNYKVPKHIHFKESLPKSNVGKILRRHMHI